MPARKIKHNLSQREFDLYLDEMKKKSKTIAKEGKDSEDKQKQSIVVAQMLGLSSFGFNNMYNSEKNLINTFVANSSNLFQFIVVIPIPLLK